MGVQRTEALKSPFRHPLPTARPLRYPFPPTRRSAETRYPATPPLFHAQAHFRLPAPCKLERATRWLSGALSTRLFLPRQLLTLIAAASLQPLVTLPPRARQRARPRPAGGRFVRYSGTAASSRRASGLISHNALMKWFR